jgi:hypothetical protein
VWVVSGDYKTDPDPTCAPFEPVRCDVLRHRVDVRPADLPLAAAARDLRDIAGVVAGNADDGRTSVLYGYAFGKAQRILAGLRDAGALDVGPIVCHGAGRGAERRVPRSGVDAAGRRIASPTSARPRSLARSCSRRRRPRARRGCGASATRATRSRRVDAPARRAPAAARSTAASRCPTTRTGRPHGGDRGDRRAARDRDARLGAIMVRHLAELGYEAGAFATEYDEEAAEAGGVKAFARLYVELDATTSTERQARGARALLRQRVAGDAAWATYFLAGGKPRQSVPSAVLREAAIEASGLAPWLLRGVLPGGRRFRRDARARACRRPSAFPIAARRVGRAPRRAARRRSGRREGAADRRLARARLERALPDDQADRRRVPRRRLASAGHARARRARGLDPKTVAQRLIGYTHLAAQHDADAFSR